MACSSHVELRLIANRSEGFRSFCSSVWQRQVLSFARVNEIFLTNRSGGFEHSFPQVAADDIVRRNPHTWPCSHAQQTAVRCVKGSGRPAVTGFNWNLCGSGRNEISKALKPALKEHELSTLYQLADWVHNEKLFVYCRKYKILPRHCSWKWWTKCVQTLQRKPLTRWSFCLSYDNLLNRPNIFGLPSLVRDKFSFIQN